MLEKDENAVALTDTAENCDTIALLKECNSGCKSAMNGMDQVYPMIQDEDLRDMVQRYRELHENYGQQCHAMLSAYSKDEKDPNPAMKVASWLSTEVKLAFRSDTARIAAVLFDGCDMGIRSLYQYLHKYPAADEEVKRLTRRLIGAAEDFRDELKPLL